MDLMEEIKKLKSLLDDGAISENEFKLLKKQVLYPVTDSNEPQKSSTPSAIQKEMLDVGIDDSNTIHRETKKKSPIIKKPIKKDNKSEEYQEGTEFTRILASLVIGAALLLSIVLWVRYDNFWIFLIVIALSILIPLRISKVTPIVSKRNLYLSLLVVIYAILIFVPIGKPNSVSSTSSEQSTESSIDEESQYIRKFLLDHIFIDNVNCDACYVRFTSDRGGWNGKATLATERVGADYIYFLNGRTIELTPVLSAFNGTNEGKFTMTFCSDNTISAYLAGQRFVFKPN